MDHPPIIEYGHGEPVAMRFIRRVPRLWWRSWVLLAIAIVLGLIFQRDYPAWKEREIVAGSPAWVLSRNENYTALLPDHNRVIKLNGSNLDIHDVETGKLLGTVGDLPGLEGPFRFSKDGRRLLCTDRDSVLRLYDMANYKLLAEIQLDHEGLGGIRQSAISDDGTRLIAQTDRSASLWDAERGKLLAHLENQIPGSSYQITKLTITADQRFAVVQQVNRIDFFRLSDGRFDHGITIPPSFEQAISRDGSMIAVASVSDRKLHILNSLGEERVPAIQVAGNVYQVEFSRDGQRIFLSVGGKVSTVNAQTGQCIQSPPLPWGPALSYEFTVSPDARWLVISGSTAQVFVFDSTTLAQTVVIPRASVDGCFSFSPDRGRFICSDRDRYGLTIWDTNTWTPISKLCSDSSTTASNWYLPSGKILTGGSTGNLSLWSLHRPERWYGIVVLPTFWLALLAVIVSLRSVMIDIRKWYRPVAI